jgi:hypothetical protein
MLDRSTRNRTLDARSCLVAIRASGSSRVQEQERVAGQMLDRHRDDVARASEPGTGVADLPFAL